APPRARRFRYGVEELQIHPVINHFNTFARNLSSELQTLAIAADQMPKTRLQDPSLQPSHAPGGQKSVYSFQQRRCVCRIPLHQLGFDIVPVIDYRDPRELDIEKWNIAGKLQRIDVDQIEA